MECTQKNILHSLFNAQMESVGIDGFSLSERVCVTNAQIKKWNTLSTTETAFCVSGHTSPQALHTSQKNTKHKQNTKHNPNIFSSHGLSFLAF